MEVVGYYDIEYTLKKESRVAIKIYISKEETGSSTQKS